MKKVKLSLKELLEISCGRFGWIYEERHGDFLDLILSPSAGMENFTGNGCGYREVCGSGENDSRSYGYCAATGLGLGVFSGAGRFYTNDFASYNSEG